MSRNPEVQRRIDELSARFELDIESEIEVAVLHTTAPELFYPRIGRAPNWLTRKLYALSSLWWNLKYRISALWFLRKYNFYKSLQEYARDRLERL